MRLIDADELSRSIQNSADLGGPLGRVVECVKLSALYMIATEPTAYPKKGKWIPCTEENDGATFTGCKCSLCNYWKPMSIWNYCPNCGADMRGENDD